MEWGAIFTPFEAPAGSRAGMSRHQIGVAYFLLHAPEERHRLFLVSGFKGFG